MANSPQLPNEPVLLHETLEDGIVRITLNRPKAANSLSHELVHELHAAFEIYAADDTVRVIILAGAGKNFCAGHDLSEGIITLPAIIAIENGAAEAIDALFSASEEARADLVPAAVEAIKQSGALEKTHKVASDYIDTAVRSLDGIPASESLDSLLLLAEFVQTRNY